MSSLAPKCLSSPRTRINTVGGHPRALEAILNELLKRAEPAVLRFTHRLPFSVPPTRIQANVNKGFSSVVSTY
jgi:hypothetical protein